VIAQDPSSDPDDRSLALRFTDSRWVTRDFRKASQQQQLSPLIRTSLVTELTSCCSFT
jgi:hypothetical protein